MIKNYQNNVPIEKGGTCSLKKTVTKNWRLLVILPLLLLILGLGTNAQTITYTDAPGNVNSGPDVDNGYPIPGVYAIDVSPVTFSAGQTVTLHFQVKYFAVPNGGSMAGTGTFSVFNGGTVTSVNSTYGGAYYDQYGGSTAKAGDYYTVDVYATVVPPVGSSGYSIKNGTTPPAGTVWLNTGCGIAFTNVQAACTAPSAVTINGSNTSYCQNNTATTLTASYSGTTATSYAWYANGTAISGATGNSFTPPTTTVGAATYTVKVTNGCGSSTAATGRTIITNGTPSITGNPTSQSSCTASGNGLTYTITATGSGTLTYLWYFSDNNGSTWNSFASYASNYPGYNSASITCGAGSVEPNGRMYHCVATNSCGSATSNAATFTLNPTPSAVTISGTDASYCQNSTATTLTASYSGTATGYAWYANGTAISGATAQTFTPSTTTAGTFAYTVNVANGCGSSSSATGRTITVNAAPSDVTISGSDASYCQNSTPTALNATYSGTATSMAWYANNTMVAIGQSSYMPSTATTGTVTYTVSASNSGCSATSAGRIIQVTTCSVPSVTINAKVFLEGAMQASGTTMRNDLQSYTDVGIAGLLPITSPYGGTTVTYTGINNLNGAAGAVVDWVSVQVRSAASPSTVLQTKYLLLKPDGSLVDANGAAPTFAPETGAVRLVVQHRNHMAIMSQDIPSFTPSAPVSYDFSTAATQAFQSKGDPVQMKLINGVYTMISGDVNNDYFINGIDKSTFLNILKLAPFGTYTVGDVNMDGVVDALDKVLFSNNYGVGYYSSVSNF